MLLVLGGVDEQLFGDLRPQLRLAGGQHLMQPAVGARLGRVALGELLGQRDLVGVDVRDRHALDLADAVAREVDADPVGHPGHGEVRDCRQRRLVVERVGEHAARLGEEALGLLGLLELGDVLDDVDRQPHGAVGLAHRPRLDARPARLAPAALAELHGQRPGLLAHQRPAPGQVHQGLRLSGRGQQLPAAHDLGQRRAQQRLGGGEAEHAHRGVVGVHERAVGPLGGNRVGDASEDRAQIVGDEPLAELGGAQLGDVLAGDERRRRAVGRLHRRGAHAQRARAARRVADDRGPAQPLAVRRAHGRQLLVGERAPVGVAAAARRQPGGGRAADAGPRPTARAPRGWRPARARCRARRPRRPSADHPGARLASSARSRSSRALTPPSPRGVSGPGTARYARPSASYSRR